MSDKVKEPQNLIPNLKLTEEEIQTVPELMEDTTSPTDFLNILNNTDTITNDRKLVIMYHFAQGHMHGTLMAFMTSELPQRMNVNDGPAS